MLAKALEVFASSVVTQGERAGFEAKSLAAQELEKNHVVLGRIPEEEYAVPTRNVFGVVKIGGLQHKVIAS